MLWNPKHDPKVDLSKPSLRGLAYLLRHRELWPAGFEWDFNTCDTCAMGLAFDLWQLGNCPSSYGMTEHFPISETDARRVFTHVRTFKSITPEIVADRLDAFTEGFSK